MKINHPTYQELLNNINDIKKYFKVDFFDVPAEDFKLVKFSNNLANNFPLIVIMAGCHGEEPASVLAIFKYYKSIAEFAKKQGVNLVIYPLVNPWGFDRNERFNSKGISCNSNWIHAVEGEIFATESSIIRNDLIKLKPKIFISLHEDAKIEKEFYIYTFGDKKYEEPLLKVGKQYFPILKEKMCYGTLIKNGIGYNHHDGTAEDLMFHQGCVFSCCTETSTHQPIEKRMDCAKDLILKAIELTKI